MNKPHNVVILINSSFTTLKTHVLGSKTQVKLLVPGSQTFGWGNRENLDWEGIILMVCRPTKRGDELRKVEPPKSFSDLMHESSFRWGSAAEGIHGLVGSSWKRDKGNPRRRKATMSWEEGLALFRI